MSAAVVLVWSYANVTGSVSEERVRKAAVELRGSRVTCFAPQMPILVASSVSVKAWTL